MASLEDTEEEGVRHLAPNSVLINEGEIEIHLSEMEKAYKSKVKKNEQDKDGIYRFIKCFAMAAGKDSTIINNGIIKIYYDFDKDSSTPVYGEIIFGGENSTLINNGEIHILGNGSYNSHIRPMAVPADNMTIINNGLINVGLERAATVRVLATTGMGGSLCNFGKIQIKTTGRIMTIGRFSHTAIINTGEIDIVSVAKYLENKVAFLYQSYPMACAFYEHFLPNKQEVPPIINSGKVRVHLEGSEESTDKAVAFGFYSELVGEEKMTHVYENTGEITVTKSGPFEFQTAEFGCNVQAAKNVPYNVEIRRWKTKKRDFAKTKNLFVVGSAFFDLSKADIYDEDGKSLPKENAVFQNEENKQRGDTFVLKI